MQSELDRQEEGLKLLEGDLSNISAQISANLSANGSADREALEMKMQDQERRLVQLQQTFTLWKNEMVSLRLLCVILKDTYPIQKTQIQLERSNRCIKDHTDSSHNYQAVNAVVIKPISRLNYY